MFFDIFLIILLAITFILYVNASFQLKQIKQKKPPSELLEPSQIDSQDPLTNTVSREVFDDRLKQIIIQNKRNKNSFGILLLDIDDFYLINEQYDYEVGDKLLREIATRLNNLTRQIDTMSRYAGNKFIFLLPQLSTPETAAYVAQRILDHLVQPFYVNKKEIYVTASIGVVVYPEDGTSSEILIQHANGALKQAKEAGGNRYQFFQQYLHVLGKRELDINTLLNSPDLLKYFKIYYQPDVNIHTKKIENIHATPCISLENHGLICYPDFERIAEKNDKLNLITEWLLKNALIYFKKLEVTEKKPEHLVIQITMKQAQTTEFIYNISKIISESLVSPNQIIFEISEDMLANKISDEKAFTMLINLGVKISISISGLGHLALKKITKLPIQYLRLSSHSLNETDPLNENQIIYHMIVTLANDMQIKIIAENVDTQKQKDIFEELGCTIMQGKLFGEPSPPESMKTTIPD